MATNMNSPKPSTASSLGLPPPLRLTSAGPVRPASPSQSASPKMHVDPVLIPVVGAGAYKKFAKWLADYLFKSTPSGWPRQLRLSPRLSLPARDVNDVNVALTNVRCVICHVVRESGIMNVPAGEWDGSRGSRQVHVPRGIQNYKHAVGVGRKV